MVIDMKEIIALDVGGSTVKCAHFTTEGILKDKWLVTSSKTEAGMQIFSDIAKSLKKRDIDLENIKGIGIGVPGPVLDTTVYEAVNLGWGTLDVKEALVKALGQEVPVYVENDANIAAYGEYFTIKDADSLALLTLGTGIGDGIILNGKIYRGVNGSAGEIGHMKMAGADGLLCNCGLKGCLETFASATGVTRHTKKFIEAGMNSSLNPAHINAKMVFDAAKAGDAVALKVVDQAAYYLAHAIANMNVILDLDNVLIGGGLSEAGLFLIDKIKAYYQDVAFKPLRGLDIKKASLGNDAGIYGAFRVVQHA